MGFGFNLLFILILVPLTGILLVVWLISRKLIVGKIIGIIWLVIFGLILISEITRVSNAKIELEKTDYYGEYIINRDYFKGIDTDWQYNHFRFEITDKDSIYFHVTDRKHIVKTYRGAIKTVTPFSSARLIIEMEQPAHHILKTNPTIYRSTRDFYLVFNSDKFYNVFFKKGKWNPID